MTVPNVFISPWPRTVGGWMRLISAYRLPLAILVVASTIIFFYTRFFVTTRREGLALHRALTAAAADTRSGPFSEATRAVFAQACVALDGEVRRLVLAVTTTLAPCYLLYVLLYWSFYRAVFTAPGFVDPDGVWRGVPVVDPHRQSQLYHVWLSAQEVLKQTQRQRAAFLAQQKAWRDFQYARTHSAPAVPAEAAMLSTEPPPLTPPPHTANAPYVAKGAEVTPKDGANPQQLASTTTTTTTPEAPHKADTMGPPSPYTRPRTTWTGMAGTDSRCDVDTLGGTQKATSIVEHNPHIVNEYEGNGAVRSCAHCGVYKPDHGHHCRLCGRCVAYMDHHCGFLNTCVGLCNYKFFLLLLFYTLCCGCINGLWILRLVFWTRGTTTHLRHLALQYKPLVRRHALASDSHSARTLAAPSAVTTPLTLAAQMEMFSARLGSAWWLAVPVSMFLIASVVCYLLSYHVELCWRGESTLERKTSASVDIIMQLTDGAYEAPGTACGSSCCVCVLLAALWDALKTRLVRLASLSVQQQQQQQEKEAPDEGFEGRPAVKETHTAPSMASRRWARIGLLFGTHQPWWFHLLPLSAPLLVSPDWMAQQGIEPLCTPFFTPRDGAHKLA